MNKTNSVIAAVATGFVPENDEEDDTATFPASTKHGDTMPSGGDGSAEPLRPENFPWDDDLDTHVRVDTDGTTFAWDPERSAWFPVFRNELIDQQQSIYDSAPQPLQQQQQQPSAGKRYTKGSGKGQQQQSDKQQHISAVKISESSVYITGLPDDITVRELTEYFAKCGLILPDPDTGRPRVKIYADPQTSKCKGDGLITFFRPESVNLAITLLDETDIRPNQRIRVEKADFSKKQAELTTAAASAVALQDDTLPLATAVTQSTKQQDYQVAVQRAKRKAEKAKMDAQIRRLERELDWADADSAANEKWLRTVILKYMFTPAEIEADPGLLLDLKADIREECEKLGEVTTVNLFEKHPDGVAVVRFKDPLSAQACVKLMNNRFFAGRQISANLQTSRLDEYQEAAVGAAGETEEEEQQRLERYARWLESGGTVVEQPNIAASNSKSISSRPVKPSVTDQISGTGGGKEFAVPPVPPTHSAKRTIDGKIKDLEQEESYFDAD